MSRKGRLTKALAIVGTVLAWFPILAPVVLSAIVLIARRMFLFDYLMPAELFFLALAGGGLLIWAAVRARAYRGVIGGGLGVAVAGLAGAQAIAFATGLASGDTEPAGWPWALVLASIGVLWLALIAVGTGGVLLVRKLFR
jgi:hypothetical protein